MASKTSGTSLTVLKNLQGQTRNRAFFVLLPSFGGPLGPVDREDFDAVLGVAPPSQLVDGVYDFCVCGIVDRTSYGKIYLVVDPAEAWVGPRMLLDCPFEPLVARAVLVRPSEYADSVVPGLCQVRVVARIIVYDGDRVSVEGGLSQTGYDTFGYLSLQGPRVIVESLFHGFPDVLVRPPGANRSVIGHLKKVQPHQSLRSTHPTFRSRFVS